MIRHGQRLLDGRSHLGWHFSAETGTAHGFGQLDVVGSALAEIDRAVATVVEQRLPLLHHAEVSVVHHEDLDRDALDGRGDELLERHLEAPVTVDGDNGLIGQRCLCPDGSGHGVSHRAESTGVDPRAGPLEAPELRRPHLVLPNPGNDDGVASGGPVQLFDDVLLLDRTVGVLLVAERVIGLPPFELLHPRSPRGRRVAIECLRGGQPLDMDVYDAAALSAVCELSEISVAEGARSVEFPDFTRGLWKERTLSAIA